MSLLIKLITIFIPILVGEWFVRYDLRNDTKKELRDTGISTKDVDYVVPFIISRRNTISASYICSFGFIARGLSILQHKLSYIFPSYFQNEISSAEYGSLGIGLGVLFLIFTIAFAQFVKSKNFVKNNRNNMSDYAIRKNSYWKSKLVSPIRYLFYLYNSIWILNL